MRGATYRKNRRAKEKRLAQQRQRQNYPAWLPQTKWEIINRPFWPIGLPLIACLACGVLGIAELSDQDIFAGTLLIVSCLANLIIAISNATKPHIRKVPIEPST